MMTRCGCREISRTPIEFEILDCPQVHINCGPLLPNTNDNDWDNLQKKIICDFQKVVKLLECGILPDIEIILEEISLIFMNSCGYNVAKKMYATDLEEDYFLRHNNFLSEFESLEEKDLVLINLGIYDKVNALVSKEEVNNIVENRINEVRIVVDRMNDVLNKKIGFVTKVENTYFAFSDASSYIEWINSGSSSASNLILAKWEAGLSSTPTPVTYDTTYYGNKVGDFALEDLLNFNSTNLKLFNYRQSVERNSSTYIITTYNISSIILGGADDTIPSKFGDPESTINYNNKLYKIYRWNHEAAINLNLNITLT